MIKEIIEQWEKNKEKLRKRIKLEIGTGTNDFYFDLDYEDLVRFIFQEVIEGFNLINLTVIDHGDYQGTRIFIVPRDTYQPSVEDYIITHDYYGSCSGCDTLMNILSDNNQEKKLNDLMTLCLHLVQKMKWLG